MGIVEQEKRRFQEKCKRRESEKIKKFEELKKAGENPEQTTLF